MKWILLLLLSNICLAKEPLRVVIVDTGLDIEDPRFSELLCKDYQGIDITEEGIEDIHGHGTHVAGIIKQFAKDSNYCLTIVKYYSEVNTDAENAKNLIKALTYVHWLKPAYVNLSNGGPEWNDEEQTLIRKTPNTKFIVAVGNKGENLDVSCNYYPACYKFENLYRVGSLRSDGKRYSGSNFGNIVNFWQIGENVESTLPDNKTGYMSGTSMATAVQTGKMIYEETHPSCAFNPKPASCP